MHFLQPSTSHQAARHSMESNILYIILYILYFILLYISYIFLQPSTSRQAARHSMESHTLEQALIKRNNLHLKKKRISIIEILIATLTLYTQSEDKVKNLGNHAGLVCGD